MVVQTPSGVVVPQYMSPGTNWAGIQLTTHPLFRSLSDQRVLLQGWPGSGKTTLVRSIDNCCNISCDYGAEDIPTTGNKSFTTEVRTYAEFKKVRDALLADAKANAKCFRTVSIDTADVLGGSQNSLIASHVMAEQKVDVIAAFGANGAGWSRLTELFARAMLDLIGAGYGLVVTCHLRRKQEKRSAGDTSVVVRDMTNRTDGLASGMASVIIGLEKRVVSESQMQQIVLPGGGIADVPGPPTERRVYRAVFSSNDQDEEEKLKNRVSLSGSMVVPEAGGWAALSARWDKAVAARKQQLGIK